MKTKLDPQEKARRQGWRTARYEARILEEAAKKLRGESPLPLPKSTRKGRTALAVLSAAAIIAGIEVPRV
jgi:hypothetical protein